MKKIIALSLVVLFTIVSTSTLAQSYPEKPTGWVNDLDNILTRAQDSLLNADLIAFEKKTSVEIVVVTISTLGGEKIDTYATNLAAKWGVGKKGKNNGVLFLIAPHKVRIETADGVNKILTNEKAKDIIDNTFIPYAKAGNLSQAIIASTHAIMQSLDPIQTQAVQLPSEKVTVEQVEKLEKRDNDYLKIAGIILVIIILLFIKIYPIYRKRCIKKAIFSDVDGIKINMDIADSLAKKDGVSPSSLNELKRLKSEYATLQQLQPSDKDITSKETIAKVESVYDGLTSVMQKMRDEAYAKKIGPALIKQIPKMLAEAEMKLSTGKESLKAKKKFEEAQTQYKELQNRQSGMTIMDWIILTSLYQTIQSNVDSAVSAHQSENSYHISDVPTTDEGNRLSNNDNDTTAYKPSGYTAQYDSPAPDNNLGFGNNDADLGGGGGFQTSSGAEGSY